MSDEIRRVLRPGHRIALGQDVYTVVQLIGTVVTLQDERGELSAVMLGYLLTAPGFEALDAVAPRRVPQDGRLSSLEAAEQERVRWLEGHIIELETGRHPEHPPRATYDAALHDIEEREQAKLAEFEAAGRPMTRRHLQRLRRAYRDEGLIGLADRRKLRTVTPGGETDPRVVTVIEKLLAEPRGRSTVARSVMFTEIQRRLDDEYGQGAVSLPSRRTLYRLLSDMDRGRRNFVSEASRRVSVNRPRRPFTPVTALRPGENVVIDTNKLDVMCRYADGVVRRAELTMAVDVATRSIPSGIIAPTTKAVDAAAVLARMLVPEPMRPGWAESMARHPKALPAELLYFLGAPHTARATETTLTHQACQLMTDFRTSLVIVDEVHEIDRSHASHNQQSDQLKYFMDHVPATFVLAGINVENCGFFTGHRGHQLARRFTTLKASPSNYSTIPQRQEWARLIDGFERALRLHAHKPGSLLPLADYLYGRTGGYIVSLSHLIRAAAIQAILTGVERIDEEVLNSVDLDHAATEEAAAQWEAAGKNRKRGKK